MSNNQINTHTTLGIHDTLTKCILVESGRILDCTIRSSNAVLLECLRSNSKSRFWQPWYNKGCSFIPGSSFCWKNWHGCILGRFSMVAIQYFFSRVGTLYISLVLGSLNTSSQSVHLYFDLFMISLSSNVCYRGECNRMCV